MKKLLVVLLCLGLCGCTTTPGLIEGAQHWPDQSVIGKTKEQILWLYGSPLNWSRHIYGDIIQETWSYEVTSFTFDFVNGKVVGCSFRGRYYSKDGIDDVRNYKNPFVQQATPKD